MHPVSIKFYRAAFRDWLVLRSVALGVLLIGSSLIVFGQTVTPDTARKPSPAAATTQVDTPGTRTNVDEIFELNIDERRYTQDSFEAGTAVGLKEAGEKLNLQIGVALTSGRIDVLMRNVHGNVRFRGTLQRVLEILNRQDPPATPPGVSPVQIPMPSPE